MDRTEEGAKGVGGLLIGLRTCTGDTQAYIMSFLARGFVVVLWKHLNRTEPFINAILECLSTVMKTLSENVYFKVAYGSCVNYVRMSILYSDRDNPS